MEARLPDERSLWDLLADIVEQRNNLLVDDDGEVMRLGEMDELLAARHIKRLVTQWGNRKRGRGAPSPLPGQTTLPLAIRPGLEEEARASVALDGETQSVEPEPEVDTSRGWQTVPEDEPASLPVSGDPESPFNQEER